MAVYNKDEGKQDGNRNEIEAAVMAVDVDSGLSRLFRCNASHCWHSSLAFGVLRRVDAQPRLSRHSNKFTPILIFGGHYDPNNSTCFIRL